MGQEMKFSYDTRVNLIIAIYLILAVISVSAIVIMLLASPVSANSTWSNVEPRGFDYFWVPANLQVIHVDYPYDFILYVFMIIGFAWTVHQFILFIRKRFCQ